MPKKCKEKFNEMGVALKRVIQKWELSGQGEGGLFDEDDNEDDNDKRNV